MTLLNTRFSDDSRFTVIRQLGTGGMGVVYEVHDRKRDAVVALKTLRAPDPTAFYNFKNEFRALADVSHPNLVSLYELIADQRQCFFTMELVEGVGFVDSVRSNRTRPDIARLRQGLKQLAAGVKAVHDADLLHCDLKPANVLVTAEDRVVILDFGLSKTLAPAVDPRTIEEGIHGTLAYMSPEQARDEGVTRASDWYAVGVMLFESLTGRLPFQDHPLQALVRKTGEAAPSPAELANDLPEDLVGLCNDLLEMYPEKRPRGAEVLKRLGVDAASLSAMAGRSHHLVGRENEMAGLEDAFARTRQGVSVSIYVHGQSGMGKTSLIQTFLKKRAARAGAVVLTGRCYERELVPYKALDGVVDSLTRRLRRLGDDEVVDLLPRDAGPLSRLFPVLRRVDAFADATRHGLEPPDRPTLRRRAFGALRELLQKIAERHPLVLYIDDLQWADSDSIVLLRDLVRPPEAPPMLLVASFRREEIEARAFLRDLLDSTGSDDCRELPLEPLADDDAAALARILLESGTLPGRKLVDNIVREALGSPFFVEQLASYVKTTDSSLSNVISLAEMLDHRLRRLPSGAERLLFTLTVAAQPLAAPVAYEAAGLEGDERPLLAALRAARFLRSSGSSERIELYHDRIRETLALSIAEPEAQGIHRRLAETLVERGFDDPEALFGHFLSAGQPEGAAGYARRAAAKATEALAFDHAAWFYERALELGTFDDEERYELMCKRAEALSNAGRPGDSAAAFLAAAGHVSGLEKQRCQRLAAHEYLGGGYFERGVAVIREVLRASGFRVPSSFAGGVLSLLWQRFRQRLRGLGYEPREPRDVADEELHRIEVARTAAYYLSSARPVLGLDFQARHMRLALDSGERLRISRAFTIEAMMRGMKGGPSRDHVARLCDTALNLARQLGEPYPLGMAHMSVGVTAYMLGQWRRAAEECDKADEIFTEQCAGVHWERTFVRKNALNSLMCLGEIAEVGRRVPVQMAEARERGHVRAVTDLRTRMTILWLAADDPERVHVEVREGLEGWDGFDLVHYTAFISRNEADLYAGEAQTAYRRLIDTWPFMKRSIFRHSQVMRTEALFLRGRTELAAATTGDKATRLEEAARTAERIRREQMPYCLALADLLSATIVFQQGDGDQACRLLIDAVEGFERLDMGLLASGARRRLGEFLGGDGGREMIETADTSMTEQGILRPERMASMLAPGF